MPVVTSKEIAKAFKLDKLGFLGNFVGWLVLQITGLSKVNKVYDKNKHLEGSAFTTGMLDGFGVKFDIPEEDLKRIPKNGAFITVSNHPLGGVDGIILLKLLVEQREDYKIIANFLLHKVIPMKPYIMPVNPFEDLKSKSSVKGIIDALRHVKDGHPLGIFPAGEVSTTYNGSIYVDRPWSLGAIKIIKKAQVPVLPIYFHATNSKTFYFLSKISDKLRTLRLPAEMLKLKNKTIKIRIGKPILLKDQKEYDDLRDFNQFLRKKTYMLANTFEKKESAIKRAKNIKLNKTAPKEIIKPIGDDKLLQEVIALRKSNDRLLESKSYEVFLAKTAQIPNILQEIGRLREITFREVGEGTNQETDLDNYDTYYRHMFLWDCKANKLAGAYRMGIGGEIFPKYGIDGYYINSLFKFEPELYNMMGKSIEMGRAFIIKEYQQKPMPLFLLWKGIVHTTLRFPEHKYLIGGVSISNKFSNFSKSLMIEFMKSHYYDPYVAQYVYPKQEYKVKLADADKDFIFDASKADLNKFDKLIDELEPGVLRIPVLLKKYVKQNAKVIAFNVDPKFNNAVDGLMYIRISDIPESTVKPVMEEFQKELEKQANEK